MPNPENRDPSPSQAVDDLGALFINCTLKPSPQGSGPGFRWPRGRVHEEDTTFMAWNLLHLARMLEDRGGMPAHGNRRYAWDAGARFDHLNSERR